MEYNAAEIFFSFELNQLHEKKIFSKMILTHESGAQEDQFDEKKWRPKISWYHPFKRILLFLGFIIRGLHSLEKKWTK